MAGFSVVTADGVERLYDGNYRLAENTGVLYIDEDYIDEYGEARRSIYLSIYLSITDVLAADHGGL
jgi:hypothetical protein